MNNFGELYEKYPMDRESMTMEQERMFVNHCFELYEKEGFSSIYWTVGSNCRDFCNKPYKVIRRVSEEDDEVVLIALPMWKIQFNDNTTFNAYPDEIIPSEMISNGCPYDLKLMLGEI